MLRLRLDMNFEPIEIMTSTGLDWYSISKLNQDGRAYQKKTNLCKLWIILSYLQFLGVQPIGLSNSKIERDTRVLRIKCLK